MIRVSIPPVGGRGKYGIAVDCSLSYIPMSSTKSCEQQHSNLSGTINLPSLPCLVGMISD